MTAKAKLLFVDDEKRVLNSMRGLFRREFELFLTTEGAKAVEIAAEHDIDVIVADQRMPGMTGIEVLGRIKQLSPRTVRILLTGYADQSAVEGSINVGEVFRFLSKPCPPKLLRETLAAAIAAARATSEAATAEPPATLRPEAPRVAAAPPARPAAAAQPPVLQPVPAQPVEPPQPEAQPAARTPAAPVGDIDKTGSHWQNVTEVVLSGDTCTEIQAEEVRRQATAITKDVGVVIFTVDSGFAEAAIRAVSTDRSTTLATTLAKVAKAVEQHDAGVLVTDFTTNSVVLQKMIGALKKHLPELVTIVVSAARDTTDMINLINYGQVFRFVLKPVDGDSLRDDINAAAIRHMHLLKHPELLQRHHVREMEAANDSSQTMNQFVRDLRDARARRIKPSGSSI